MRERKAHFETLIALLIALIALVLVVLGAHYIPTPILTVSAAIVIVLWLIAVAL